MPTGLKDKEDQLNPGQNSYNQMVDRNQAAASSLSSQEQGALEEIEANFDQDADSSQEDANIRGVKNAEESPNALQKTPTETTKESDTQQLSRRQRALNFAKKKGPMSFIIMILLGGGGVVGGISSAGLAPIQMKNALTQSLNDALPVLDERGNQIMRAQMKERTRGLCTSKMSFRCKYKSISKNQAKRLAQQGFTLENRKVNKLGRVTFTGLTYREPGLALKSVPQPDGSVKIEATQPITVDAKNHYKFMRENVDYRSKVMKSFNPRFESFRNKVATNVYSKFKVSLTRALNGPREAMKKQYNNMIRNGIDEIDGRKIKKVTDKDGKVTYVDSTGREVTNLNEAQKAAIDADDGQSKIKGFDGKNHGLKGMLQNGFHASNMAIGTQLMLCHTLGMVEVASLAAKNIKYAQLIRYVVPLLNTADSIKSGDGIMEATTFMGDILTHVDLREKAINESEGSLGDILTKEEFDGGKLSDLEIKPETNPHYGKSAFDSAGYKLAAYGEVNTLDMRESQYKLGGTFGGNKLTSMMDSMVQVVNSLPGSPGFSKDQCDFFENPIVQGVTFAISIAGIIGTGVGGAVAQGAKAAATMAASLVVQSYVRGMIDEIVKGELADADTKGIDAGNAFFSGAAALMGSLASSNGLNPLSTTREISQSQKIALEAQKSYDEVARYEARDTPFDIYNQYSFLGTIVSKMYPAAVSANSMAAMALSSPLTYLSTAVSFLHPTAGASTSPISRYTQCEDPAFQDINLESADQMCNIRFGNSPDELYADPEKVADWMVDAGQVDPDNGDINTSEEAVTKIAQVPVTAQEASTVLHNADDPNPPAQVASIERSNPNNSSVKLAAALQPGDSPDFPIEPEAEKNVRTYAHWVRYCRFGDDSGRNVNFGDEDSSGEDSILTGLTEKSYVSDGRECLKANNCRPGQNPNGTPKQKKIGDKIVWVVEGDGRDAMKIRCRPPQYSIYSIFHVDSSVLQSMEAEEEQQQSSTDTVSGDARELAKQLTENENIEFVNPATPKALLKFAETGEATNFCGQKFAINAILSGTILTLAKNYKILVNNFGFQEDRFIGCDQGMHPKGNAVDLNGIEKIGGGKTAWGSMSFSSSEIGVITEYTTDWIDAAVSQDPNRGRVGQLGCGGFDMRTKRKPSWKGPDGSLHFNDACNHLHIDVGDRTDGSKI